MAAVEGDELLDYEEETEEVAAADKGDKGSDAKKIKVRSSEEKSSSRERIPHAGQLCVDLQQRFPRFPAEAGVVARGRRLWL